MHRSCLTDRVKPVRLSTCVADPANVELVSQQLSAIGFSGQCSECKCTDFPGDYLIQLEPAKAEISEHLSHAHLEHKYDYAYSEHLFIPPPVSIQESFSVLMLLLEDH